MIPNDLFKYNLHAVTFYCCFYNGNGLTGDGAAIVAAATGPGHDTPNNTGYCFTNTGVSNVPGGW
jgi:hypothetical protein